MPGSTSVSRARAEQHSRRSKNVRTIPKGRKHVFLIRKQPLWFTGSFLTDRAFREKPLIIANSTENIDPRGGDDSIDGKSVRTSICNQEVTKLPLRSYLDSVKRLGCQRIIPAAKLNEMKTTEQHEATSRMSLGLHPRRILALIDFEAGSQKVLDCALQYAEMHGASVHFLHVIEKASFISGMGDVVLALSEEERVEEARIALLEFMDQRDRRGLEASPMVRSGKPEQEVASATEELGADLLILSADKGKQRAWGARSAEKIIESARCSALLLKEQD
jgi:nucleotide-binding universal stress UspA family protein